MVGRFLRIALVTDPIAAVMVPSMGITSAVADLLDRRGHWGHWVAAFWSRALLRVAGVKLDVAGTEKVPRGRPVVFAANHRSMIDIPVLMSVLPVSHRYLAKRSLVWMPFIGWHLVLGGHVLVHRATKAGAVKTFSAALKRLEEGTPVVVFAEGGRSEDRLRSFKQGAARLALRAGAPVVPVGITGSAPVLPKGSCHVRPGRIRVRVGDPIETRGMTKRDAEPLTRKMEAAVASLIAEPAPEAA